MAARIWSHVFRSNLPTIIGGDFNGVVGQRHGYDNRDFVGEFGIGSRNERGNLLVEWATSRKLVIANTRLRKPLDKQWTQTRRHLKTN